MDSRSILYVGTVLVSPPSLDNETVKVSSVGTVYIPSFTQTGSRSWSDLLGRYEIF